jgi:hypothetical protein
MRRLNPRDNYRLLLSIYKSKDGYYYFGTKKEHPKDIPVDRGISADSAFDRVRHLNRRKL